MACPYDLWCRFKGLLPEAEQSRNLLVFALRLTPESNVPISLNRGIMDQEIPERASVLIVDDEWLIRAALVDHLQNQGFEVFEAESASEALQMLQAHHQIGVVVTDIQMPGSMDGLALARLIRDSYPPIRLIIASGAIRPTEAELPRDTVFLSKPIDLDGLPSLLR